VKQVLIRGGTAAVDEVPAPGVPPRGLLVRVAGSTISAGTERASVELSKLPLYRRALAQPHHAKRALEVARRDGFVRTYKRVKDQVDAGLPIGYSAAGVVVEVGEEVVGFAPGDRVACAGAGIANHAELIAVPVNLAVRVPEGVDLEDAATVTLGAIALQGVRRAGPTLGETVGVLGLGILGQLTVQLLRAVGCRVVVFDPDPARVALAIAHGALDGTGDFAERARAHTDGFGLDAAIVTAATSSSDPMHVAAESCRRKGRVVIVGDVGLDLKRADLYQKELDVLMSTSYGPGRYDAVYEIEGRDYPIGYVRWTENRNMAEYLDLLASGGVRLDGFLREQYDVDDADSAYAAVSRDGERPLLVFLRYPERAESQTRKVVLRNVPPAAGKVGVAIVGAGSFALGTHIPNLRKHDDVFTLRCVMSRTGSTARAVAERNGAAYATTDFDEVLHDADVDLVLISTRHDLHAPLTLAALRAGKNVFVEKPLALHEAELAEIEAFFAGVGADAPLLMTGFNRRFSPAAAQARAALAGRTTPLVADYRMNAGHIPLDHWVHGPEGGGRNIGEACHVYDLFDSLVGGADVRRVTAQAIAPTSGRLARNDNFTATISYADGSLCTLTYTALGNAEHAKERMDVFSDNTVVSLDDYKSLTVTGRGNGWRGATQNKGHEEELEALAGALRDGGPWPIPLEEQLRAMRIAFAVEEAIRASPDE
jgi:predicted dehydrogenase/threonine dehydrogenase-like Zn-dependent dehydrogenase